MLQQHTATRELKWKKKENRGAEKQTARSEEKERVKQAKSLILECLAKFSYQRCSVQASSSICLRRTEKSRHLAPDKNAARCLTFLLSSSWLCLSSLVSFLLPFFHFFAFFFASSHRELGGSLVGPAREKEARKENRARWNGVRCSFISLALFLYWNGILISFFFLLQLLRQSTLLTPWVSTELCYVHTIHPLNSIAEE